MKEEEYLKEYFKQLKSEKLEKAKRLVNLARHYSYTYQQQLLFFYLPLS